MYPREKPRDDLDVKHELWTDRFAGSYTLVTDEETGARRLDVFHDDGLANYFGPDSSLSCFLWSGVFIGDVTILTLSVIELGAIVLASVMALGAYDLFEAWEDIKKFYGHLNDVGKGFIDFWREFFDHMQNDADQMKHACGLN